MTEMLTKIKKVGLTLLEILISMAVFAVVITISFGILGNIYRQQKHLALSQSFFDETRFILEQIVQSVRNNTVDYDRFFQEIGPSNDVSACPSFDPQQLPPTLAEQTENTAQIRELISYPEIFYWGDPDNETNSRQMGGMKSDGVTIDPCSFAFSGSGSALYLINAERSVQTAYRFQNGALQSQKRLGVDQDGDRKVDFWGTNTCFTSGSPGQCKLDVTGDGDCNDTEDAVIFGDYSSENFCLQAHDFVTISPPPIEITSLIFDPHPRRDPYLAFRVDSDQVHPFVNIYLSSRLRDHSYYGLSSAPQAFLQTTASSRVFGNSRE